MVFVADNLFAGNSGPVGPAGPTGPTGPTGATGAAGKTVLNGSGAPSAGLGTNGDFYIDTVAEAIYGPKTAGAWGSATSLIGPQGPAGTLPTPQISQNTSPVSVSGGDASAHTLETITFTPTNSPHLFNFLIMVANGNTNMGWFIEVLEDGVVIPFSPSGGLESTFNSPLSTQDYFFSATFWYTPTNASHTYTLQIAAAFAANAYTIHYSQLGIL